MPSAEVLKKALISYDEKIVSSEQIATMLRVWPKDTNMEDFAKEKLDTDEFWAPSEAFMQKLLKPKTILDRLKVWEFKENWEKSGEMISNFYDKCTAA